MNSNHLKQNASSSRIYYMLKIVCFLAFLAHAFYLFVFFLIGYEVLVVVNIFSVFIYFYILSLLFQKNPPGNICLALFQIEIMVHAIVCMVVIGWGYGFEILIVALLITTLFVEIGHKKISYFIVFLQPIIFVVLFILYGDSYKIVGFWRDFLFFCNVILVCSFSVVLSYFLEASNQELYMKAQKEKENLKNISNQDHLTKLLNRNSLQEFIDTYLVKNKSFAVMIGDIDKFKKINDTYGHNVGDMTLVKVSNIFKNIFRKDDFLCRWGGEEFLAIIYDIDKKGAINVVKRAKDTLAASHINHNGEEIRITMTFGLVYFDGYEEFDINEMIKRADELLYQGKNSGKNKIVFE